MLIDYVNGQTGVILRLKARQDNTGARPGQGFTGLSSTSSGLIISTIADAEASATAYSTSGGTIDAIATLGVYAAPTTGHCRIREVDPTNHPGLIELQLANARFAVLGSKELTITVTGVAGMADCDAKVPLRSVNPYDGQAFGLAALPAAGTLAVSPILAASQSFNNPGQTSAIPANAVQFAGQAISAAAPVSVPASIGTSTFAPGGTVNVGQIGGQSVTASGPIAVLASVGTATTSTAQSGDSFARLGAPATTSISSDIQTRSTYAGGPVASVTGSVGSVTAPVTLPSTVPSGYATSASQASLAATLGTPATTSIAGDIATRSTYSGGPVASVTAPVTLPSSVPTGYATSASQAALAATLGAPVTASISSDIQTRSTYAGGPVASVTGSVGSVTAPVAISATGLDAVKGWGSWSARQTIQAIAQVLFGVRSGVPPVGSPGTVTFTGPASAAYGSLSVDNSGNVTATNLTPPA